MSSRIEPCSAHSRLTIDEVRMRFPAMDIAIVRCLWTLDGHVSAAGDALPTRHGVLVNTLRREAGAWLIIDSQNTDMVEGALSRPQ